MREVPNTPLASSRLLVRIWAVLQEQEDHPCPLGFLEKSVTPREVQKIPIVSSGGAEGSLSPETRDSCYGLFARSRKTIHAPAFGPQRKSVTPGWVQKVAVVLFRGAEGSLFPGTECNWY